jgi:hypothetical protein
LAQFLSSSGQVQSTSQSRRPSSPRTSQPKETIRTKSFIRSTSLPYLPLAAVEKRILLFCILPFFPFNLAQRFAAGIRTNCGFSKAATFFFFGSLA